MDLDQRARHGRAGPDHRRGGVRPLHLAIKDERVAASKILKGPSKKYRGSKKALVAAIHDALYCSKICSYAQGFQLMRAGAKEYKWKLNFGEIAQIWRGGCIIRAAFLQKITEAYARNPNLANLLLDPYFNKTFKNAQAELAQGDRARRRMRRARPDLQRVAGLLRRLPLGPPAGQPPPGPARLLRRPHLRAHRPPRGKFFHLDWPDPKRPQLEV